MCSIDEDIWETLGEIQFNNKEEEKEKNFSAAGVLLCPSYANVYHAFLGDRV